MENIDVIKDTLGISTCIILIFIIYAMTESGYDTLSIFNRLIGS